MTAKRLQAILGAAIEEINNMGSNPKTRKELIEKADCLTKLARQHINNMQVTILAAKLSTDKDLKNKTVDQLLGEMS